LDPTVGLGKIGNRIVWFSIVRMEKRVVMGEVVQME